MPHPPSQAASIYGETDKLIRAGRAVQALGPNLFGDSAGQVMVLNEYDPDNAKLLSSSASAGRSGATPT